MGRNRKIEGDDGVTIRVLEWCGKYLTPLGLSEETTSIEEYRKIRAHKEMSYDDRDPSEADMVRRPYGSTAAVD